MKSSILQVVIGIIIITIIHFGEVAHATSDSANFVDTVLTETTQSQLARKRYWNFYTRNELEEIWNVPINPESRFDCSLDRNKICLYRMPQHKPENIKKF